MARAGLAGLPYYGGKHYLAPWIVRNLPLDSNLSYLEPFCGMASVLLTMPKRDIETLNDSNRLIVDWWEAVRTYPDELNRLIDYTPHSRTVYEQACQMLQSPDDLDLLTRAWAIQVMMVQSVRHNQMMTGSWRRQVSLGPRNNARYKAGNAVKYQALAKRLEHVQLENCDALDLIERYAPDNRTILYIDPPYRTAVTTPYAHDQVDYERLGQLMLDQQGYVAVSGYPDDWPELDQAGWVRLTRTNVVNTFSVNKSEKVYVPKNLFGESLSEPNVCG